MQKRSDAVMDKWLKKLGEIQEQKEALEKRIKTTRKELKASEVGQRYEQEKADLRELKMYYNEVSSDIRGYTKGLKEETCDTGSEEAVTEARSSKKANTVTELKVAGG